MFKILLGSILLDFRLISCMAQTLAGKEFHAPALQD
jgi:hypothetical protein